MRIIMAMTVLAPLGGIEAALLPVVKGLKHLGNEVIVYTIHRPVSPNQNQEYLQELGVPVLSNPDWINELTGWIIAHRLRWIKVLLILCSPAIISIAVVDAVWRLRSMKRSIQGATGVLRGQLAKLLEVEGCYYLKLAQFLRQKPELISDPPIVHVHGWGCGADPVGLLRWLSKRKSTNKQRLPVVYTEHNSPEPGWQIIRDAPMNLADYLIAVSQAGKTGLENIGLAKRPIEVIPYPVEPLPTSLRQRDPEFFTLTCFARLAPQKNHAVLLEAMSQIYNTIFNNNFLLSKDKRHIRLWIAGEGPLKNELITQAKVLNLYFDAQNGILTDDKPSVEFIGLVTHAELPELLARTDVIVLASLWEGLPVSLIEAMSAGKAIIATRVGGNPELVKENVNGLLVPPSDPQALANAILELYFDPEKVKQMEKASLKIFGAGQFSPEVIVEQHLNLYHLAQESVNSE